MGLAKSAGKENPVELDSSLTLEKDILGINATSETMIIATFPPG
ncbi:3963_t:CDS:2 [Entrophospora sp. SA101]|nr:1265_t:CDS:2 [Entrophospora sp. SA101]CAJ0627371.1 5129_t:CDS:2 [Entrophospora sp. SA101]CAJ0751298.1 3963_t:CDS:2 [Entrophospora sp. SA101]CAJ0884620.1 17049_t:CDS:2 [Entrophospora sp. SA101]